MAAGGQHRLERGANPDAQSRVDATPSAFEVGVHDGERAFHGGKYIMERILHRTARTFVDHRFCSKSKMFPRVSIPVLEG